VVIWYYGGLVQKGALGRLKDAVFAVPSGAAVEMMEKDQDRKALGDLY